MPKIETLVDEGLGVSFGVQIGIFRIIKKADYLHHCLSSSPLTPISDIK